VPAGHEAQFVCFRGANASDELVCAIVMRGGEPMRPFRSARALIRTSRSGHLVVNVGLMEI
jgi:hypothetical protein